MAVYAVATPVVLLIARRWLVPMMRSAVSPPVARGFALLTAAVLIGVFAVGFPVANSGRFGPGSDTDEAYNEALAAIRSGESPYSRTTYLDNRVHHMPGALLLAAPFALAGESAWQNVFWLVVAFAVARAVYGSTIEALVLAWTVLLLSPAVLHQTVTGSDKVTNAVQVLAFTWLTAGAGGRWGVVAGVGLGVALSSRPNFLLGVPTLVAWLAHHRGRRAAAAQTTAAALGWSAVTLPFLVVDPAGFAPLEGLNRLTRFSTVVPHAPELVVGLTLAAAWWLGRRCAPGGLDGLLACSGLVQAVPVLAGVVLASQQAGAIDLTYLGYGGFFAPWMAIGYWPRAMRRNAER